MYDRLTDLAQKRAQSSIIVPVIVMSDKRRLQSVIENIRPYLLGDDDSVFRPRLLERSFGLLGNTANNLMNLFSPFMQLRRFNMFSAILPRETVFDLAEDRDVQKIFYDRPMRIFSYPTVPHGGHYTYTNRKGKQLDFTSTEWTRKAIGADIANKKGYNGEDVSVSILDTGGARVHEQIRRVKFRTVIPQERDENGHGTWCVSCVGGISGYDEIMSRKANKEIKCLGMAPRCNLEAIKCLGYYIGTGSNSGIIRAIEMALEGNNDVISMSLGGTSESKSPQEDSFFSVFQEVEKEGIIPVVAAGNEGSDPNTIGTPGSLPNVLTVGAYDPLNGKTAKFSSRGPTNWGDIKPDVTSPGVNINSGTVGMCDKAGDGIPNRYSPISGTSMATPHVAGLIALMKQSHRELLNRNLTTIEVKRMMEALGHTKNHNSGWGAITWNLYEEWLSTQYGVTI